MVRLLHLRAGGWLVFAQLYFAPLGQGSVLAQMVSWASLRISVLFRPLGAVIAGHVGDRFGRKKVLVATLILMGSATTLIGILPTHAQIGIAAPLLLVLLRIIQGISAGGEWGGAALMAGLYLLALVWMTSGNSLTYGPLSALFAERLPAEIRYSGISIAYAIGAVLGGAFAPLAAEWLLGATQSSLSIAAYVMILCIASFIGAVLIREPKGIDLSPGASPALASRP